MVWKLITQSLVIVYMPDLIVTINGAKWVVEIKRNKSDFMSTAVSLELWSKYKSTYFV